MTHDLDLGDAAVLSQHPGVSTYDLDDELVVYDPRSAQSYVLNHTGRLVWTLCDGTRTVQDVAQALSDTFAISLPRAQSDVLSLVRDLHGAGLVTTSGPT